MHLFILVQISMNFVTVPKGLIDNKLALAQEMNKHRQGNKPISKSMMTQLTEGCLCQWVDSKSWSGSRGKADPKWFPSQGASNGESVSLMMSWHGNTPLLALCEGNPPVNGGFSSWRASNAELSCFPCCYSGQAVEQMVELTVISDTTTVI